MNLKEWQLIYISEKIFGDYRLLFDKGLKDPRIQKIFLKLKEGIPLAKIFQEKHFWKHVFKTNYHTLDPRPESELIIEFALKKYKKDSKMHILDLGTGTGALILSLLAEFPNWTGVAIDCCSKALDVAKENAEKMNLVNRCKFIKNNWLENLEEKLAENKIFHLCVSNPPYILPSEETFAPYDPNLALFTPKILTFYEKIYENRHLFKEIIMEINHKYSSEYLKLFSGGKVLKYNGYDRCLFFQV